MCCALVSCRGITSYIAIDVEGDVSARVRMTVQWFVLPRESAPIVAALHALMVVARAEPGCLGCQLSTEVNGRVTLRYIEEWRNENDLKRQLCSSWFARLAELLERGTETPNVQFTLPSGIRGLEYAEEVRQRQAESK
jgi:quinol monooxygenase YgiN